MIKSHTMRFATDMFGDFEVQDDPPATPTNPDDDNPASSTPGTGTAFPKKALLISKKAWDCTGKAAVKGFIIGGIEPSGSKRRFMFKFDGNVYKLSGAVPALYSGDLTADNVLADGNTAAQLTALTSIPDFVGKKIYPIIALYAPGDAADFPTANIKLKTQVAADKLTSTEESLVYELTDDLEAAPRIIEATANVTLTGDATVDIKIKLRTDGTWSSYMALSDAADKDAQAVQFQITRKVTKTDGTDSAKVNTITVEHTLGKTVVSGDNAELYSVVADYDNDLKSCFVAVKHNPLNDSRIEAYVNFAKPPDTRTFLYIGTGNGSRKEFVLGAGGTPDANIDFNSLEIFGKGEAVGDFTFNSETSTVALNSVNARSYTASYNYNLAAENWRKMTLDCTEPYNDETGTCLTRFYYELDDPAGLSVSNVRIKMIRPSGAVTDYSLGTASGKLQLFVLPHRAKAATIAFDAAAEFNYDEESNILSVLAAKNTPLNVSYSWIGEEVTVYSLACGWSCS